MDESLLALLQADPELNNLADFSFNFVIYLLCVRFYYFFLCAFRRKRTRNIFSGRTEDIFKKHAQGRKIFDTDAHGRIMRLGAHGTTSLVTATLNSHNG